jgi:hypothetical protein
MKLLPRTKHRVKPHCGVLVKAIGMSLAKHDADSIKLNKSETHLLKGDTHDGSGNGNDGSSRASHESC